MFMVKDEWTNTKNLLRVRLKVQVKDFVLLFIIMSLFLGVSLGGTIFRIVRSEYFIRFYNLNDESIMFLFGVVFVIVAQVLSYRNTNNRLSVFPQSNSSRFASSIIFSVIWIVVLSLCLLLSYLIKYSVLRILSAFMDNIHFALDFSFGFAVAGIFVYIAYCLLILAVFELIGAVFRKWNFYALLVLIAIFIIAYSNIDAAIEHAINILSFLTGEASLILFFIKSIGLIVAIFALAYVINRNTIYNMSKVRSLNNGIVAGLIIVSVAVMSIVLLRSSSPPTSIISAIDGSPIPFEEIRIDISHLPNGSDIELLLNNDREILIDVVTGARFFNETAVSLGGTEFLLNNIQGDELVIAYSLPTFQAEGIMLNDFANPQITARLDGSTLVIDYSIDNAQIIILPIWGIARQFDAFYNKNLFTLNAVGFSAGGSMIIHAILRIE
ncbi:MAG: hypothetical protein FWF81_07775 [Defluviitaleaceae bacterium]|nr:hypothetical protein [Defluviitaleaceae bacterium]